MASSGAGRMATRIGPMYRDGTTAASWGMNRAGRWVVALGRFAGATRAKHSILGFINKKIIIHHKHWL